MPSEQAPQVPRIEVTSIKEEELQAPVAAKLLHKRCTELEQDIISLKSELATERVRRDQLTTQFHDSNTARQVLSERLGSLGDRNSVSQLIWGAISVTLGILIDFMRSGRWEYAAFSTGVVIFLGVAVYLVNRARQNGSR